MRTFLTSAVPEQVGSALPGEVLTRRAITASIVVMTFALSVELPVRRTG